MYIYIYTHDPVYLHLRGCSIAAGVLSKLGNTPFTPTTTTTITIINNNNHTNDNDNNATNHNNQHNSLVIHLLVQY